MRPPKIEMRPAPEKLIELVVTVGFTGGCCFTLTTYDVAATLEVPEGVEVVSGPDPPRYAEIVGPPGGVKQGIAEFRWRLRKADEEAVYTIRVAVTTRNSGTVEKDYQLTKPLPCRISEPEVAHPAPSGTPAPVKVDVVSNKEDRFVTRVTLCYVAGLPPTASELEAEGETVTYVMEGGARSADGQTVAMARKYEPTVWRGSLPEHRPGSLYYWMVAEDSAGELTTGPVYELWVVDFRRSRLALNLMNWGLGLCVAVALGLMLGRPRNRVPLSPGLLPLGAPAAISFAGQVAAEEPSRPRRRVITAGLCVLVSALLVAALLHPEHLRQLLALWRGS